MNGNFHSCWSSNSKLPPVAVTMGDPNGVGPEIFLKSWPALQRICQPIFYGQQKVLEHYASKLQLPLPPCPVVEVGEGIAPTPGYLSVQGGEVSARCVLEAIQACLDGTVAAMVTLPISKEAINLAGYHYAGHTEMLGEYTGTDSQTMMLVGGDIRIVLATTHVPLRAVVPALSTQKIQNAIHHAYVGMAELGISSPRVAVCALNPHSGDGGVCGNEDQQLIAPAVREYDKRHLCHTLGPLPSDSLFASMHARKAYDVAVCMYHDQGLIPVKMASFGRGVNVTLGLPIVRTSVDHGTAFDIAGQGIANHDSLLQATQIALQIAAHRQSKLLQKESWS
ncbi:4-hydroxythreonine-4-phosphate dehydrogenase PdxA [Desulfurispira natronophila]|uniref:4-hydroxythreonine-4-phosphate dehydrogenase n=1 Tax=Desulfurispira natronophila TaxID=682562 RepID=A0A7W7Y5K5_9BACT|nr:4-hydroxythreonine-4-phosphate dehydrogenase PdxA [Desulfurispira natronophila]MBB5022478.1 4-hydroxythreonine-4-phosphate dehydrogenase [Desulfurispira natronophila]